MAVRKLSVVLDLDTSRWNGSLAGASGDVRKFGGTIKSVGSEVDRFVGQMGRVERAVTSPTARIRDLVVILGQARSAFLTLKDVSVGWLGAIFKQAGEVERLTVLMKGLSSATDELGKSKEAQNNLTALYGIARTSGFAVQELADSFVKIKSGGIDPMNGSLRGLVDATAAFGGNSDTLHRAAIAIQQMAGKGVISMEELRQQLGEAVPSAMALMARSMDKTLPELAKMIAKGTVEAKPALAKMFAEMERVYHGAGERLSSTLFGQMAQMRTNFAQLATDFTGMGQKDGFFSNLVAKMQELNALMRSSDARAFLASLGQGVGNVAGLFVNLIELIVRFKDEVGFALKAMATIWAGNTLLAGFTRLKTSLTELRGTLATLSFNSGGIQSATTAQINHNAAVAMGKVIATESAQAEAQRATALADVAVAEQRAAEFTTRRAVADRQAAAATVTTLSAQQTARRNLVATMEAEQMAALNAIQTGRNERGQFVQRAVAMEEYTRATERLRVARGMLVTTSGALVVAEGQLATATTAATAAIQAEGAATIIAAEAVATETAAVAADTVAKRVWTQVTAAGSVAASAFGAAVNIALGPIGMIAILAYQAASAFGVFETAADRATAAAERMAQGYMKAGDAAKVAQQRAALAKEASDLNGDMGKVVSTADKAGGKTGVLYFTDDGRRKRLAEIEAKDAELANTELKSKNSEYLRRQNEWHSAVVNDHDKFLDNLTLSYNRQLSVAQKNITDEKKLQDRQVALRQSYDKLAADDLKKRTGNLEKMIGDRERRGLNAGPMKSALAQLQRQAMDTAGGLDKVTDAAGKGGKNFQGTMATAAGQVAQLGAQLNGSSGYLAKFNAEVAAGAPKFKDWTKAQIDVVRGQMAMKDALAAAKGGQSTDKAFDSQLTSLAGKIGQLRDELQGGEGDLASFEARVKAGAFAGVSQAKIDQMREYVKIIDGLNADKTKKASTARLDTEMSKARTEADALWKSMAAGTMDTDKRLAQITSRFAGLTDGLKGEDLANAEAKIAQIVADLKRADAAEITQGWKDSTQEILNSLLDENLARQRNFELEVARQQQLLDLTARGTDERRRMEQQFNAWKNAQAQRVARENEGATTKMMRNWAQLGQGIDQLWANTISGLVDGMFDADFNMGKFIASMIKNLLKMIVQAMIAYAILSAIGLTPQDSSGNKLSMGGFLKNQAGAGLGSIGNKAPTSGTSIGIGGNTGTYNTPGIGDGFKMAHTGGLIGGALKSSGVANPAMFSAAKKYHGGGWIGGRQLRPGEHPIIGKEKELVLTEEQQNLLGAKMNGGQGQMPNVQVNIINNSNQPLDAEQGEPQMDGRDMILNVVVEGLSRQGKLRDAVQAVK